MLRDRLDSSLSRDWLVVVACLICQIGMGVGGYIFPVFLKPVASELDWSRTAYALASPIMTTSVALLGPLIGRISDRRGPRPVLVTGSLVMSATLLGAAFMHTPIEFYLVAVGVGAGVACLGDLPTAAAIAGRFRERRGLALGAVYVGSNIGGSLGPLIALLVAGESSWRFGLAALGSTLWMLLLPAAWLVGRPASGSEPEAVQVVDVGRTGDDGVDQGRVHALRTRDFWLFAWAIFAFLVYRLGVNVHLVAYLSDAGYSDASAAGGFSLMLAVGIVGKLGAGAFADRFGPRWAAVGDFALVAAASLLLLAPPVWQVVGLFLVLNGIATSAEDVVVPLLVGRRFGVRALASVYGLLLLALVPGGAVGPVVAGWIYDALGSYTPIFAVFALLNISSVFALLAIDARPRDVGDA